jgi:hypothetical protein
MRFSKDLTNSARFNLAESARRISDTTAHMAYWAALLVNDKYAPRC